MAFALASCLNLGELYDLFVTQISTEKKIISNSISIYLVRLERDNPYKCLVCQYEQNQIPQTILTPLAPASLFLPFCSLGIPWAQSPPVTEVNLCLLFLQ